MTETVKLKSPVDGSIYVERPVATDQQISRAVEAARAAQPDWAARSIADRCKYVLAMLEALVGMSDEIVPELAHMMGRPVRYGGEFGGVKERTTYMVEIAEQALKPVMASNPKDGFTRYVKKDPLGVVMVIAPWNYPYLTAVNTIVPALIGELVRVEPEHRGQARSRPIIRGQGQVHDKAVAVRSRHRDALADGRRELRREILVGRQLRVLSARGIAQV